MKEKDKLIITSYLQQPLDSFEISAGRIIIDSRSETRKAGVNEDEESKAVGKKYFQELKKKVKVIICEEYGDQISKINSKSGNVVELVGYIAAILESNSVSVGPLNYIFISVWIVKTGLSELCQEE